MNTIAQMAAAHWGGQVVRLIRERENAVYEMTVPNGRAALRLHRAGYQGAAAIRSELWWCDALARAGVAVSTPLVAASGELLVTLPDGRLASAIGWVDGTPIGEAGIPFAEPPAEQMARHAALGRLLRQLHDKTDELTLPDGFSRPRWDQAGLVGEAPFWGRFWDHPLATLDQRRTLLAARDYVSAKIAAHQGSFGLIHADVLRENIFVNGSSVSLIDFDDSGWGYRLYDLGTVLSQHLYEPHYPELRAALMQGYGTDDRDMVDTFTLARTLASVGWTMPRLGPDDPVHRSHLARAVMCAERLM